MSAAMTQRSNPEETRIIPSTLRDRVVLYNHAAIMRRLSISNPVTDAFPPMSIRCQRRLSRQGTQKRQRWIADLDI